MGTAIPHHPHGLIGIGFLDGLVGADFVHSPNVAFENIVFLLQSGKKAGKTAADIVDVATAAPAVLLIVHQILAQIIGSDERRAYQGYAATWQCWSGNNAMSFRCNPRHT